MELNYQLAFVHVQPSLVELRGMLPSIVFCEGGQPPGAVEHSIGALNGALIEVWPCPLLERNLFSRQTN
jgi:hypothetical protein